ncbi:MAG: phosphatase PAP2 family protein [Candidatus Dormibacteria bacterium]
MSAPCCCQSPPDHQPFLATPVFPSYVSGHSTYSAAAAEVLSLLFPQHADRFAAMAREAAVSRLYAGIHYRSDNEAGLVLGRKVGQAVVDVVRRDGAGTA